MWVRVCVCTCLRACVYTHVGEGGQGRGAREREVAYRPSIYRQGMPANYCCSLPLYDVHMACHHLLHASPCKPLHSSSTLCMRTNCMHACAVQAAPHSMRLQCCPRQRHACVHCIALLRPQEQLLQLGSLSRLRGLWLPEWACDRLQMLLWQQQLVACGMPLVGAVLLGVPPLAQGEGDVCVEEGVGGGGLDRQCRGSMGMHCMHALSSCSSPPSGPATTSVPSLHNAHAHARRCPVGLFGALWGNQENQVVEGLGACHAQHPTLTPHTHRPTHPPAARACAPAPGGCRTVSGVSDTPVVSAPACCVRQGPSASSGSPERARACTGRCGCHQLDMCM